MDPIEDCIELFVKYQLNININFTIPFTQDLLTIVKSNDIINSIHLYDCFEYACKIGDKNTVQYFLDRTVTSIRGMDLALFNGHYEINQMINQKLLTILN